MNTYKNIQEMQSVVIIWKRYINDFASIVVVNMALQYSLIERRTSRYQYAWFVIV